MNLLRLLPVILSFLLLGAHFTRNGSTLLAILAVAAPVLLYFTQAWAARLIQVLLLLGALEWLITLVRLVQLRMEMGLDWGRMAAILVCVALVTACSSLVFYLKPLHKKYQL